MSEANAGYELRTHASIREIGARAWNELAAEAPPFLSYAWLEAFENSGAVRPECGWAPLLLSLYQGSRLMMVAPAYVKGNSEGEFVFDHSWARFAIERLGIEYYPKLIVAVPFTPANGPRLLVRPDADHDAVYGAMSRGLPDLLEALELSSVHVLFPEKTEASRFVHHGFAERYGVQFHWRNAGYTCFEDFVKRFGSKRRNQIRRERKALTEQGLEVVHLTGKDVSEEAVDAMFRFYCSTVQKYFWGKQYLNRQFFFEVCSTMSESLHLVLARDTATRRFIGGAFNLLGKRALYGRYWGASEERPFLHFNLCFYEGIQACIERGLTLFEPGAGGEHKLARGFEPTLTHSAHFLRDPRLDAAVRDFLVRERRALTLHVAEAERSPVLRR